MSAVRPLVDVAGRPRSPATTPGFHAGRAPRNQGQRYPADPPTVDEIVSVMRQAKQARYGARLNGLIVVLWRTGLRIHEALSLMETDLDPRRGSILIKHGKGDRRRELGMDAWARAAIQPWRAERAQLPVGPLFCVIVARLVAVTGRERARLELHRTANQAGVRRRVAPHQLRHAHAVELLPERIPLPMIQRQLGHSHLSTTGTYLQGISSEEILHRPRPTSTDDARQRRPRPVALGGRAPSAPAPSRPAVLALLRPTGRPNILCSRTPAFHRRTSQVARSLFVQGGCEHRPLGDASVVGRA